MEERSLRIYADKTFFTKLTNTLTKMLIPTKIGINSVIITLKRNNVLKAFENYIDDNSNDETNKKEISRNSSYLCRESARHHFLDRRLFRPDSG